MANNEIHIGDIGTTFRFTIKDQSSSIVDVSGATTKEIRFKLPNNSVIKKTALFETDGTDGIITYQTVSGDLPVAGDWDVQAFIVLPTGTWYSDIKEFKVYKNL